MFGTFILITWIAGMWFIINEIINAPEYDAYERPKNKRNG
jgi:hypothetical protein